MNIDNDTKRFLSHRLKWIGLYLGISLVLVLVLPAPYDLISVFGLFVLVNYLRVKGIIFKGHVKKGRIKDLFGSLVPSTSGNDQGKPLKAEAEVEVGDAGSDGVLAAIGGITSGWSLYVKDGKPTFYYNFFEVDHARIQSSEALPKGTSTVRMELIPVEPDLVDAIWTDRPAPPLGAVKLHDRRFAGEAASEKLARIRAELAKQRADALVVSVRGDPVVEGRAAHRPGRAGFSGNKSCTVMANEDGRAGDWAQRSARW